MSARKRRSLLGGAPASGPLVAPPGSESTAAQDAPAADLSVDTPPTAAPVGPEVAMVGAAPVAQESAEGPSPAPIGLAPGEQFEADLPPPVMSRSRRRQQRAAAGWDAVKLEEPAVADASASAAASASSAASASAASAALSSASAASAASAALSSASEPVAEVAPPPADSGPSGEPSTGRPARSKSLFGDLKVVEYASGRKPATEAPSFRAAPPEDAGVFVSSNAKGVAAATSAETLRFGRKLTGRSTPPGRPRGERPEADAKSGHRVPLTWSEAIPDHNWSPDRTVNSATPALPPTKRVVIADRPAVASVELVSPAQLPPVPPPATKKPTPAPVEPPPLEAIQAASEPTLPGLLEEPPMSARPVSSPSGRPVRTGEADAEDAWLARAPAPDESDEPLGEAKSGIAPWMFAIPLGVIAVLLAAYLLLAH